MLFKKINVLFVNLVELTQSNPFIIEQYKSENVTVQ